VLLNKYSGIRSKPATGHIRRVGFFRFGGALETRRISKGKQRWTVHSTVPSLTRRVSIHVIHHEPLFSSPPSTHVRTKKTRKFLNHFHCYPIKPRIPPGNEPEIEIKKKSRFAREKPTFRPRSFPPLKFFHGFGNDAQFPNHQTKCLSRLCAARTL
jgi:hypothetical protein